MRIFFYYLNLFLWYIFDINFFHSVFSYLFFYFLGYEEVLEHLLAEANESENMVDNISNRNQETGKENSFHEKNRDERLNEDSTQDDGTEDTVVGETKGQTNGHEEKVNKNDSPLNLCLLQNNNNFENDNTHFIKNSNFANKDSVMEKFCEVQKCENNDIPKNISDKIFLNKNLIEQKNSKTRNYGSNENNWDSSNSFKQLLLDVISNNASKNCIETCNSGDKPYNKKTSMFAKSTKQNEKNFSAYSVKNKFLNILGNIKGVDKQATANKQQDPGFFACNTGFPESFKVLENNKYSFLATQKDDICNSSVDYVLDLSNKCIYNDTIKPSSVIKSNMDNGKKPKNDTSSLDLNSFPYAFYTKHFQNLFMLSLANQQNKKIFEDKKFSDKDTILAKNFDYLPMNSASFFPSSANDFTHMNTNKLKFLNETIFENSMRIDFLKKYQNKSSSRFPDVTAVTNHTPIQQPCKGRLSETFAKTDNFISASFSGNKNSNFSRMFLENPTSSNPMYLNNPYENKKQSFTDARCREAA